MTGIALISLVALGVADIPVHGPRVLVLQEGRVVQAWPSQDVPRQIRPHAERPFARPFGPHPGEATGSHLAETGTADGNGLVEANGSADGVRRAAGAKHESADALGGNSSGAIVRPSLRKERRVPVKLAPYRRTRPVESSSPEQI